jgi:hypothetical protein
MANSLNITAVLRNSALNSTTGLTLVQSEDIEVALPSAADDQEVVLNVANPKVIIISGAGEGCSVRLVETTGTVIPCNPIVVLTDMEGFAQPSLFFSNAGSLEQVVRVMVGG